MLEDENDSKAEDAAQGSLPGKTSQASKPQLSVEEKKALLDKEIADRELRVKGLQDEEQKVLKSIHDARAERRTLSTSSDQDGADNTSSRTQKPAADAQKTLEKAAEVRAIRQFTTKHPEYADSAKWQQLQTMYNARRGSLLWEDVVEDLEDAHLLLNRDSLSQEAEKKAKDEIAKKMLSNSQADIGGTSSSGPSGSSKVLTDEEKKLLAKLKKVDPKMTEERFIKRKESLMSS